MFHSNSFLFLRQRIIGIHSVIHYEKTHCKIHSTILYLPYELDEDGNESTSGHLKR